ncbi:hypothetical protein MP228_000494 [Amoeboaphelidium protococcarum]|nr:hypothetical protein MP228_000494 [Amoeboaphelidium protococcarum]
MIILVRCQDDGLANMLCDRLNSIINLNVPLQRPSLLNGQVYAVNLNQLRLHFTSQLDQIGYARLPAIQNGPKINEEVQAVPFRVKREVQEFSTLSHPLAVINVAVLESGNVVDQLTALQQKQQSQQTKNIPEYMHQDLLYYNLIVSVQNMQTQTANHDQVLAQVKSKFGLHCYLLQTQQQDDQLLIQFIREFMCQSLIPFMDRSMQLWNENYANPRRGLSGRLFSVGRRYFTTSAAKQSSLQQLSVAGTVKSVYLPQSTEITLQRLADYSFMLKDYRFAYVIYDIVKKDFQSDRAVKYYANAQHMIALCIILQVAQLSNSMNSSSNSESISSKDYEQYLESAFNGFVNSEDLTEAVLCVVSVHSALVEAKMYREAAKSLLMIIPVIDALSVGFVYEQSAYCYKMLGLMRKYCQFSFHAAQQYIEAKNRSRIGNILMPFIKDQQNVRLYGSLYGSLASLLLQDCQECQLQPSKVIDDFCIGSIQSSLSEKAEIELLNIYDKDAKSQQQQQQSDSQKSQCSFLIIVWKIFSLSEVSSQEDLLQLSPPNKQQLSTASKKIWLQVSLMVWNSLSTQVQLQDSQVGISIGEQKYQSLSQSIALPGRQTTILKFKFQNPFASPLNARLNAIAFSIQGQKYNIICQNNFSRTLLKAQAASSMQRLSISSRLERRSVMSLKKESNSNSNQRTQQTSDDCPVIVDYYEKVVNDTLPANIKQMMLVLKNTSWFMTIEYVIDLEQDTESSSQPLWLGCSMIKGGLVASETKEIPLQLYIPPAGVVDLARWQIQIVASSGNSFAKKKFTIKPNDPYFIRHNCS